MRISQGQAAKLGLGGLSFGVRASARTKYGNVPTFYESQVVGGKTFDSKWEADLCRILDVMVQKGEIRTFLDQVRISLASKTDSGQRRYMAVDFMLIDNFGRSHFWDAKGRTSAKWSLQRDMAWQLHTIDVKAVVRNAAFPQIYEDDEIDLAMGLG